MKKFAARFNERPPLDRGTASANNYSYEIWFAERAIRTMMGSSVWGVDCALLFAIIPGTRFRCSLAANSLAAAMPFCIYTSRNFRPQRAG